MRSGFVPLLFCAAVFTSCPSVTADDATANQRTIQALLVTGGCCHDYDRQKLILTRGVSARADVRWTVVHQGGTTTNTPIPLYNDPNWADGFDIVVHNECFSDVKDLQFVDRILKPHRDGLPAILIHCAMHCYRVEDDRWFKFVGMQSPGHGPHYSYTAENLKPDHPIMQGFGPSFVAPKGELYHSMKVFETATPLAQANRDSDGMPQVCVWTNDYNGTRVFGCTMGHYNETMAEPKYLDMIAKAVLWAVGRDTEKDFTPTTEKIDEDIKALINAPIQNAGANHLLPQNCCGDGNLAYQKPVTSKSEQDGNFRKHLTDGRLDTRWCPNGSQIDEWVSVDLEEPQHIRAIRLHWEKPGEVVYKYIVEVSADNENWKQIVDDSKNKEPGAVRAHKVDAPDTRYIRTTFLGATRGLWGSLWELEASAGELPELAEVVTTSGVASASIADVQIQPGFNVTLFGKPPEVGYPVCLTAAATGEVFVGVDEMGSLGKEAGRGKVLRCIDTDGDGTADQINEFAKMDHPRGLIYDDRSLWVLHPPTLSVFRDTDGDGKADESEILIEGISTDEVNRRGADHTTNGIRMGIDGWIYIAVGDYGFTNAVGKDGTTLSKRGGGIVRVRPDGTEMEIYSWGQRNILDVAIDPYMNIFTRDNTNDGGGWDIRVSHILQTANYGYPSLYRNFTEEIMPPLADYGGGSGCGSLYFHDHRWPYPYNRVLLTCDWGRSEVFSHQLEYEGATFVDQQETFLKIPRPTDIDADGSGRMYVSSWKNGKFAYDGPNVGFVAMVTPEGYVPHPIPDVKSLDDDALVALLNNRSAAMHLHVQREILRRPSIDAEALVSMIRNHDLPLKPLIAAMWTLRQKNWDAFRTEFPEMMKTPAFRAQAIRAATDRLSQLDASMQIPIARVLFDDESDDQMRAAAIIALGRMNVRDAAKRLLKFATMDNTVATADAEVAGIDDWRLPHSERVIPHLAVKALVSMNAVDECIAALSTPEQAGALWALKSMHSKSAIDGLFKVLSTTRDAALRREIWTTLIRLYHREGDFIKDSPRWWGTRPDTTGPYYDRQTWSESERIADAVRVALSEADEPLATHLTTQLKRHVVNLDGIRAADVAALTEPESAIQLPKVDPNNPNQIANLPYEEVLSRAVAAKGNSEAGQALFRTQSCISCHTFANGQQPKGPHLVDIGKRYKTEELIESIVDPSRKIAQGFDTWSFVMSSGKVVSGFVVLESAETVTIRQTDGLSRELLQDDIDDRVKQELSMMPKGLGANLTPEQLADLVAYLQTLH